MGKNLILSNYLKSKFEYVLSASVQQIMTGIYSRPWEFSDTYSNTQNNRMMHDIW